MSHTASAPQTQFEDDQDATLHITDQSGHSTGDGPSHPSIPRSNDPLDRSASRSGSVPVGSTVDTPVKSRSTEQSSPTSTYAFVSGMTKPSTSGSDLSQYSIDAESSAAPSEAEAEFPRESDAATHSPQKLTADETAVDRIPTASTSSESLEHFTHSREPTSILPTPPLQHTSDEQYEPGFQASEEYDNIMNEIQNAIDETHVGQSSPYASSFYSSEVPQSGVAVSTSDSSGRMEATGSASLQPSPNPPGAVVSAQPSPMALDQAQDAAQNTLFAASPDHAEDTEVFDGHPAPLASPSIYSNPSHSKDRRTSSYIAREPNIKTHSPSMPSGAPTTAQLARLNQRHASPPCLDWRDVTQRKSPGERWVAYAHKINELSTIESGLQVWIALKRQGAVQQQYAPQQNLSRRGSLDSTGLLSSYTRTNQRPHLRHQESVDFSMRPDASKATDLTGYATQAVPSSFNNADVPYPGVSQQQAPPTHPSHRMSSGGFSLQKSPGYASNSGWSSQMSGAKAAFFSLGRRASTQRGNAATPPPPQRPLSSSPSAQSFQSLTRPPMKIGGPRNSMTSTDAASISSKTSAQNTITRDKIERLGDILPQASTEQLQTYLRKASGDSTLALQCFLEDERTGNLL